MRLKTKNGKQKLFYLEEETIQEIKKESGVLGLSESSYIDYIIKRNKLNMNPLERLNRLKFEKEKLQEEMNKIDIAEKQCIEDANKISEWQKVKLSQKPKAISILVNKIYNEEFEHAQSIAKHWASSLGVSPEELLAEASSKIRKGV